MERNKIEQLIEEDLVNHQTSNVGSGYTWHNRQNPTKVSLVDILKVDKTDWEKAKKVLPYQLDSVFDKLLNISDTAEEIKGDFIKAYHNPMVKGDDDTKKLIKDIVNDINSLNKHIAQIGEKFNTLQY